MRVVSENSEEDIARERAKQRVQWSARELTANLVRVTRGAGKPHEIGPQAVKLINAMQDFFDVAKYYPVDEIDVALQLPPRDEWVPRASEDEITRHYAERSVVAGALQVAASQLIA